jgi:ABC-2 type transport system permease protein
LQPVEARSGSIYDLGYRRYEGARLGRHYAALALYLYTLRGAFGLGRRTGAKIIPTLVVILAFLPAVAQLGIAALVSGDVQVITPDGYFGFVQVAVALFCAAIAPEVAGRDMRQRTLSLYFSRSLRRRDYAIAKIAAFATALSLITLMPQAVLVVGNGLATKDLWGYIQDHYWDLPRTVVSGLMIATTAACVCLAIAAQTPRRAYATIAVVAWFLVTFPLDNILVNEVGGIGRFAILLSPFEFLYGATLWVFRVSPEAGSPLDNAGFAMWVYPLVAVAYAAGGFFLVIRRFDRIST